MVRVSPSRAAVSIYLNTMPINSTEPAKRPARPFTYFCRTCCANFVGDAARRHRAFMQREYERRSAPERTQRVA